MNSISTRPSLLHKSLPALLLAVTLSSAHAQQETIINWDHSWDWMHPMGTMPPRPAGGADTDFTTTWYLEQAAFATQYDGPTFGAVPTVPGVAGTTASYDSGRGPGPVSYGEFEQYIATPRPAPAEFTATASRLTLPFPNNRHTAYFRTTFTIPNDGRTYQNPVLRYILDDGGYVYLDGVPILNVNMTAGVADVYTQVTAGKVETESAVRTAELFLPVNTITGASPLAAPAIAGNAAVLARVATLAPGEHTLAISVHNEGGGSSDIGLAVQLLADASDCVIAATSTTAVRDLQGDAENLTNDTLGFSVTVTGTGVLSPSGWVVTGPAGSSLLGQTGSYDTERPFNAVPIAEFPDVGMVLEVSDAATPACKATVTIQPPQRLGSVIAGAVSSLFLTKVPWIPVWVLDEPAGTLTLNNSGAGADRIVESLPVDLSGASGDLRITAELEVRDISSGFESGDNFLAELVLSDGATTTTLNLITPYDTNGSGRMNGGTGTAGDEFNQAKLAVGNYTSNFALSGIVPDSAVSATLFIRGVAESPSETLIVRNIRLESAPHSIVLATAGPAVMNNQGTPDAGDDTFTVPVNITTASLPPGSLGWTSNSTPASGLYATAGPVTFGPFPMAGGAQTITLTDDPVTSVTSNTLTINPPGPPAVTATLTAGSIVRQSNGAGVADDTVTFSATVTASMGGPGYVVSASGGATVAADGAYSAAPVTFTLSNVPVSGTVTVTFTDASYPAATDTLAIAVPEIYIIGQKDFGGGMEEVSVAPGITPAAQWVIDSALRTLTMSNGGAGDKTVESETIDLSTVDAVDFSAVFRARDTSLTSNFETGDKFKAELIIDGTTVVNLISDYDTGDGASSSVGANGPPDGYLNGYQGFGTTNPAILADYNAHNVRDELNFAGANGETQVDSSITLRYTIPAGAGSVALKISGAGVSGSEFFYVSDILFVASVTGPDSDSDGIPDSVEDAAGLDRNTPADAALDLDGDGQSNLAEYGAGTDLTDPGSRFHITAVTRAGGSATLRWASVAGESYRIQSAPEPGGPWVFASGIIPGNPDNTPGADQGTQSATVTLPAPADDAYCLRVVIP